MVNGIHKMAEFSKEQVSFNHRAVDRNRRSGGETHLLGLWRVIDARAPRLGELILTVHKVASEEVNACQVENREEGSLVSHNWSCTSKAPWPRVPLVRVAIQAGRVIPVIMKSQLS